MRTAFPLQSVVVRSLPALGLLALTALARPAAAQLLPPTDQAAPVFSVRAGAYFPSNRRIKNQVGKTFAGVGLDYAVANKPGFTSTRLSLDYIERTSSGKTVRIFPVTVGQFYYQGANSGVRPYLGFGVGAYFVKQEVDDDLGNREDNNDTRFGGYVTGGFDFSSNLFLEARYHFIQAVGSANPSGLQVMGGVRF